MEYYIRYKRKKEKRRKRDFLCINKEIRKIARISKGKNIVWKSVYTLLPARLCI